MGLRIDEELFLKYRDFYSVATGKYEDVLVLTQLSDESALLLSDEQKNARLVAVTKSPRLSSLSFLEGFKNAEHIAVNSCPRADKLWDLSQCPKLVGIAVLNCKRINSLDGLEKKPGLKNFLFECGVFNRTALKSFEPVMKCRELETLDLATTSVKDKTRIDFEKQWPRLESLTVSPSLRKYFIKLGGK